jgi:hypothetical protein
MKLCGHKTLSMHYRYDIITGDDLKRAVGKFESGQRRVRERPRGGTISGTGRARRSDGRV